MNDKMKEYIKSLIEEVDSAGMSENVSKELDNYNWKDYLYELADKEDGDFWILIDDINMIISGESE
ncbi:MAG: hypothetical protein ACRC0S_02160 [Fusobacteriaceae bacterium]